MKGRQMIFAKKLKQLRQQNDWSQEQLADRLNVTRQAVAKWERGAGFPDIDNMQALAKLFNTSVDELLDYTRAGLASAMREPLDLDAYPTDTKGYSASDLAVADKFADADHIESLNRHRRLTWWQQIIDFFVGAGTLDVAFSGEAIGQLKGDRRYYLVEKSGRSWIVEVTKHTLNVVS
jgi:DNA-binding protein